MNRDWEKGLRFDYDVEKDIWEQSDILLSVESESFASGAFRAAYHIYVLEEDKTTSHHVGKRYVELDANSRERHGEDVREMAVSRFYAIRYNAWDPPPPKMVEFQRTCLIQLVNRPEKPYYSLEPYISGEYLKYMTNSGWVDTEHLRATPHVFSHFSFENSGHQLIVVDIQGVNDMYTDPQIHTLNSAEFGNGNLGMKGMALFLYTHECNQLCLRMGLKQFILYKKHKPQVRSAELWRNTTLTQSMADISEVFAAMRLKAASRSKQSQPCTTSSGILRSTKRVETSELHRKIPGYLPIPCVIPLNPTIDGQIHFEMARMHETGRLTMLDDLWDSKKDERLKQSVNMIKDMKPNAEAAFHHIQLAAFQGVVPAMMALARMLSDLPCEFLQELSEGLDVPRVSLQYLELAAERGEFLASLSLARNFSNPASPFLNLSTAVKWYEKALQQYEQGASASEEEELFGWRSETPKYSVLSELAEVLVEGPQKDTSRASELFNEAADDAMAAFKGKLANRFYERGAQCESE